MRHVSSWQNQATTMLVPRDKMYVLVTLLRGKQVAGVVGQCCPDGECGITAVC